MKHKWLATYCGVGEYDLVREDDLQKIIEANRAAGDSDTNRDFESYQEFATLAEAKKFIRECIACDRRDLSMAIYRLRKKAR